MKQFFLLCFLSVSHFVFSQSKIEMEIHLLEPGGISDANFVQEEFIDFAKKVNVILEKSFAEEKGDKDILTYIHIPKKGKNEYRLYAKPALENVKMEEVEKQLESITLLNGKYVDYEYAVVIHINEGSSESDEFHAPPISFEEEEVNQYESLDFKDKYEYLKKWAKDELVPMFASIESQAEAQFEGVVNFGKLALENSYGEKGIDVQTSKNSDYWRANLEMDVRNQIIPLTKACMYMAEGHFEQVADYLEFILAFSGEDGNVAKIIAQEINFKLGIFNTEFQAELDKGIQLHDEGKYKEAIAIYDELLEAYPTNGLLLYEHYLSNMKLLDLDTEVKPYWKKCKDDIYKYHPRFNIFSHASNGEEGYEMALRMKLKEAFQGEGNVMTKFLNYAEINLELGNYDFAAQMYWWAVTAFSKEEEELALNLERFLYCLDKLGDKTVRENFKIDYGTIFPKLDEFYENKKKTSPFYQIRGGE